jgi:hypothetical protein
VQSLLLSSSGTINDLFSRGSSRDKAFAFILEFGTFPDLLFLRQGVQREDLKARKYGFLSIFFNEMK